MDHRRKQYASETRLNISRMKIVQSRDEESLKNLRNLNLNLELLQKKQTDLKDAIEKRKENIFVLEQREKDFLSGKLDQEISKELKKNTCEANIRFESSKKKDLNKQEKKFNQFDYGYNAEERNRQKDYIYYYRLYCKANETLPEYMRENLADMPNNKGYIWRDCWFFGEKAQEHGQPTIMFEKKKGSVMHIHEIDNYEHKIFEKIGKEKKKLISSSIQRNTKKN